VYDKLLKPRQPFLITLYFHVLLQDESLPSPRRKTQVDAPRFPEVSAVVVGENTVRDMTLAQWGIEPRRFEATYVPASSTADRSYRPLMRGNVRIRTPTDAMLQSHTNAYCRLMC